MTAYHNLQVLIAGNWHNAQEYAELKEIRNVLAHRVSYGRSLHASVGGAPQPQDEWQLKNITLNDQLTRSRRNWLATTLKGLVEGAEAYAYTTL